MTPYRTDYIETAREFIVAYWRDRLHQTPPDDTASQAYYTNERCRIQEAGLDKLLVELKAVDGIFTLAIQDIEDYLEAKEAKND